MKINKIILDDNKIYNSYLIYKVNIPEHIYTNINEVLPEPVPGNTITIISNNNHTDIGSAFELPQIDTSGC